MAANGAPSRGARCLSGLIIRDTIRSRRFMEFNTGHALLYFIRLNDVLFGITIA